MSLDVTNGQWRPEAVGLWTVSGKYISRLMCEKKSFAAKTLRLNVLTVAKQSVSDILEFFQINHNL